MPVVKDAKRARVDVGEVQEVVQVVAPQGLQDGEELEGQVGHLFRGGAVEVAQRAGAGADRESAAGAQVLGKRPALSAREDLQSRTGEVFGNEREHHREAAPALSLTAPLLSPNTSAACPSAHFLPLAPRTPCPFLSIVGG